jgi:hypothetical protein
MTELCILNLPLNYNLRDLRINFKCFGKITSLQILENENKYCMDIRLFFEPSSVNRHFYFIKEAVDEDGETEFMTDRGEIFLIGNKVNARVDTLLESFKVNSPQGELTHMYSSLSVLI